MAVPFRRILGLGFDGRPIYAPKHAHSLLLAAAGGGKTTSGAVPWLQSLLADFSRAIVIVDSKEGEIAAQSIPMCLKHGRKVALIDEFGVLGFDHPQRVSLNRLGAVVSSFESARGELIFSTSNACHALIEEPARDQRNAYWRDEPRTLIEFVINALLRRNPAMATVGGVWVVLSDPEMLVNIATVEVEEGDEAAQALARHTLDIMQGEHAGQHRSAAIKALRIYGAGSALHQAGVGAQKTHRKLIDERAVIFLAGPVRHMERLGPDYALQLQSFMEVVLSGTAPPVSFILDEFTNAPLQALVAQLTTMRGYGGTCHMIAQSRSEIERRYGDKEAQTIDENSVVKQWFGFSSFKEAEAVSRAMGDSLMVSKSIGLNSDKSAFSSNINLSTQRLMTPDELMRLPKGEQIMHVKDVGWIHCEKISQNQIAPYCDDLAPNPLEGGVLPPDPKVTLDTTPINAPIDEEDDQ